MTGKQEELIPRTPEAEAKHQKLLKHCQDELFLTSALKGLIDPWLVSDGENTEILSVGLANIARPIIEKQERERIIRELIKIPETIKDNKAGALFLAQIRPLRQALKEGRA